MDVVRINYADFAIRRPSAVNVAEPTAVSVRVDSLLAANTRLGKGQCTGQRDHPVRGQLWLPKAECRVCHSWVKLPAVPQQQDVHIRSRHLFGTADRATSVTNDALNKVTSENYERMLLRILTSVRSSPEPLLICNAILRKCYEQDFFIQVYLRILTDVLEQALGDEKGVMARLDLSDFASRTMSLDLLTSFPRSLGNTNCSGSGYDGFCERVKAKKQLIGRARTTIGLIERGLVSSTHEEFFQGAANALEGICSKPHSPSVSESVSKDPQTELDYDDDHADIAIEYLKEIVRVREERTPSRLHRLATLLETHVSHACSLMCRFKLQGIIGSDLPLPPAPEPAVSVPDWGGEWKTIANGTDRRRGVRQLRHHGHTNVRL